LLLGPSFIGLFAPEFVSFIFPDEVKGPLALLAKIGLLLMLFQVGMEFDFSHLRDKSKVVVTSSLMGILAPLAGGLAIAPWLHRTFAPDLPDVRLPALRLHRAGDLRAADHGPHPA
jgi:Kef-type K+ transport system membrane component KefB